MKSFNKKYILAALLAFVVAGSACNKELDQLPNNSVSAGLVFTNITGAESAFNGTYAPLYSGSYYGRNSVVLPDLLTENLIAGSWFSNSYSDIVRWSYSSGQGEATNVWAALYPALHRVNTFLANIDNVAAGPGEDANVVNTKKAQFKSQVTALRAMYMFDLLRWYCKYDLADQLGLPFVTTPTTEIMHKRKTVKETYDQIVKDLTEAANTIGETNAGKQTVITKYFIYALQSRVYLYFKDWDNAILAADKVLTVPTFGYETTQANLQKLWTNDVSTKEIIFKIGITSVTEATAQNYGVFFIADNNGTLKPNPDFFPSLAVASLFSATDLRKNIYLKRDSARQYKDSIWVVNKYPGNPDLKALNEKANAVKIFRYAEVALNKMEASYYKDKTVSKTLLKALRVARITGYDATLVDAYDDATLLAEIRKERHRELAFEGHRFYDLKRWGIGFTKNRDGLFQAVESAIGTIDPANHRWVWPIPQAERESNKLADQNPGYSN